MRVSPDGSRIAFIQTIDGRGEIRVRDLASGRVTRVYRDAERSLSNVVLSADGGWLLFLQDAGGDEGFHLYRLAAGAGRARPSDLTPFPGIEAAIVALPRLAPGTAVVALNRRDPEHPDVFSIDLSTGTLTETLRNDKAFTDFWAGDHGLVQVAQSIRTDGTIVLWSRTVGGVGWKEIYEAPAFERFTFQQILPGGREAIARTNRSLDQERIVRLDLLTGNVTGIPGGTCGKFDDDKLIVSASGNPAIRACTMIRPTLSGMTPSAERAIAATRALIGEDAGIEFESASADLATIVFFTDRSDRSGEYILYRNGKAERLSALRPWLENRHFQPSEAVWIAARDGLPLLSYLTRPASGADPAPLIVSIHGGPWTRDTGGFEPTTQMLANRGYAVLQVNFRGSTGLGKKHAEAGVGEFGNAMSDDIVDAARWAVEHGMADPKRMCVMGGSYGGYATLVSMTRDADIFGCGIDFAGPANLVTLMEAFPPSWQPYLPRSWYRFVGNPHVSSDRAQMIDRSPLEHIERLSRPMLIFQGANDPRVTQAQSDAVVCALREQGIAVDYLLARQEGHSFGNEETSLSVNRAVEEFLSAQLGGKVSPVLEDRTSSALGALRAAGASIACGTAG